MITETQFNAWRKQGYNWLPLTDELPGDLDTPLSIYFKLGLVDKPNSYLLEPGWSVTSKGRYSYIGLSKHSKITVKNHCVRLTQLDKTTEFISADPLAYIQQFLDQFNVPLINSSPHFTGGLVGYFGYDTIRYVEKRLDKFTQNDPLNIPDIYLILTDELIVYDSLHEKIQIIVYVDAHETNAYQNAITRINHIKTKLNTTPYKLPPIKNERQTVFSSNITKENYEAAVIKAKEYFKAGDAMQLILSQRFSKPYASSAINLYRTLRYLNPSPYMYFLNLEYFHIVGASPEVLVHLQDDKIIVRPLAGTKPRGKDKTEDKRLETELLADPKEIAEHLMLIDLGRNDIGKVCKIGTVKVTEQMVVERYSHVMHISSTVEGEVLSDKTMMDVLRATFPAGTVSGAPKVRAMEIIDQLENDQRAIYGGAVGYLGWHGNMDMAIALRTALIKDGILSIQAGAGLVADSNPESEWQECMNKAKALFLAAELSTQNDIELCHDIDDR